MMKINTTCVMLFPMHWKMLEVVLPFVSTGMITEVSPGLLRWVWKLNHFYMWQETMTPNKGNSILNILKYLFRARNSEIVLRGGEQHFFWDPPPSGRKTNHVRPPSRQSDFHVPPPHEQILQYFQKYFTKNIFLWQKRYSYVETLLHVLCKFESNQGLGKGPTRQRN